MLCVAHCWLSSNWNGTLDVWVDRWSKGRISGDGYVLVVKWLNKWIRCEGERKDNHLISIHLSGMHCTFTLHIKKYKRVEIKSAGFMLHEYIDTIPYSAIPARRFLRFARRSGRHWATAKTHPWQEPVVWCGVVWYDIATSSLHTNLDASALEAKVLSAYDGRVNKVETRGSE